MDFGSFILVALLVYVLSEVIKRKAPTVWARFDLFLVLALGIAVVFAVSYSDWADEQIIMGKALDQLSIISRVIAGVVVAAVAVGLDKVQAAVRNAGVGEYETE